MKTIKGRFCTSSGAPASNGRLTLELMSEEPFHELTPIGDAAKDLLVPIDEEFLKTWRKKESWRTPEDLAAEEAKQFAPTYDIPPTYEFDLDEDGRIPAGTVVVGNDELAGNTWYRAVATMPPPSNVSIGPNDSCRPVVYRNEELKIEGDAPIYLLPEPEIVPPTPRELELAAIVRDGTPRLGKKNRNGFFAGPIHYSPTTIADPVSAPSLDRGEFGVLGFTLPTPAVVNRVTVQIDAASSGTLLVGLYNVNGSKVVETQIDLNQQGCATGIFASEVNLTEGDYFLAWATRTRWAGRLRGLGFTEQLNLMNASGSPTIGAGRSADRKTLPSTLGEFKFSGTDVKPILAYFKA
jgi:hypothetical protein